MHITCNFHVNALRQSQQIPLVCRCRSRRIYAETGSKQRNNAPIYCRLRHAHTARALSCTAAAHRAAEHQLGYHWFLPDGSCTTHIHTQPLRVQHMLGSSHTIRCMQKQNSKFLQYMLTPRLLWERACSAVHTLDLIWKLLSVVSCFVRSSYAPHKCNNEIIERTSAVLISKLNSLSNRNSINRLNAQAQCKYVQRRSKTSERAKEKK